MFEQLKKKEKEIETKKEITKIKFQLVEIFLIKLK